MLFIAPKYLIVSYADSLNANSVCFKAQKRKMKVVLN